MLKTIKTPLTVLTILAILCVSVFTIVISIKEHENLYRESVTKDLDGLSENLSNDLVTLIANETSDFELLTVLLRLDRYANVKYAGVYAEQGTKLTSYIGNAQGDLGGWEKLTLTQLRDKYPLGMSIDKANLIAFKVIGDKRLPQGYLLIVNDLDKPLSISKRNMLVNILPLVLIAVFVSLLLTYLLLNKLLKPLIQLSHFANSVRKTKDYSLRPESKGYFEIAKLTANIEAMMDTTSEQLEKNKEYTRQLLDQQKAMERLANFDSLTGLPNRQFFVETLRVELARAKREKSDVALLFFDLDGFKNINDSFGHEVGDKLLVQVGQKVRGYLRDGDVISRLGGDEFLVLLHNNPDQYVLANIADRIINGLKDSFEIDEWKLSVGASIGIARASESNFNLSEFISNADLAMYRSKLEGRGKYTVFVGSMMEDAKRKMQIAGAIEDAIRNNHFKVYYQPKVNADGHTMGYEALIRWIDEDLGFVSPAEFIPIAEQSGKISAITSWVMTRVFTELPDFVKENPNIKVSMNLSAIDIKNKSLFTEIQTKMSQYQVAAENIEFEVTESAYLENFEQANQVFSNLQKMGCTIALDDFGTGYSSLAYLTQISLDTLKIDKQFVDNLGHSDSSTLITSAIIDMANRLELQICAEGVETREQADFLISQGCQQLQGYFFGRPAPLEDVLSKYN
ncbi:putative bifunctional diguanylate cyclase/phosphodiesterase [Aliiglaciecola litoralis]|uniref:Diguanylate cyclase/phosphodiesterase n=1 Tax=Aliiglaciecola litoralis TaxID=582857 RepID=A0ABP3WTC5_9ALTE